MTVESATLGKPGPGECRVSFSSRDEGSVLFEAFREGPVAAGTAASGDAVRRGAAPGAPRRRGHLALGRAARRRRSSAAGALP